MSIEFVCDIWTKCSIAFDESDHKGLKKQHVKSNISTKCRMESTHTRNKNGTRYYETTWHLRWPQSVNKNATQLNANTDNNNAKNRVETKPKISKNDCFEGKAIRAYSPFVNIIIKWFNNENNAYISAKDGKWERERKRERMIDWWRNAYWANSTETGWLILNHSFIFSQTLKVHPCFQLKFIAASKEMEDLAKTAPCSVVKN